MSNKLKSMLKKLKRLGYRFRKEKAVDPVCGMEVNADLISATHQNKSYFFCSDHCRREFNDNPSKYAV